MSSCHFAKTEKVSKCQSEQKMGEQLTVWAIDEEESGKLSDRKVGVSNNWVGN